MGALSQRIVELHEDGVSEADIIKALTDAGMQENQAVHLIGNVLDLYDASGELYRPKTWLEQHPRLRGLLFMAAGFLGLLAGSLCLYWLGTLGFSTFKAIGLYTMGKWVQGLLHYSAGALVGLLAIGFASEQRSAGLFIGCWLGAISYYLWLILW